MVADVLFPIENHHIPFVKSLKRREKNKMKIQKRSGEFRGRNWCAKARDYDELKLERVKNVHYDNAIIAKDIIKGYLRGEFEISEFADLVNQGIEDDYLMQEAGKARNDRLVKCLTRACMCEHRKAEFPDPKEIEVGDYLVSVKPDAVFYNGDSIDLVIYRVGKPDVKMKGRGRDTSVNQSLELYFLLQYGKTLLAEGEVMTLRANYYYLRKTTDMSDNSSWDNDFFSEQGGNIVYLEQAWIGGKDVQTPMDIQFKKLLEEYDIGTECTEEECKKCIWNPSCNYIRMPELYQPVETAKKNTKIIPSDAQQSIINFRKGICRVNAAAGSGKTECMTERGVQMFMEGVKPSEVLFITFTNAGANEMKQRIKKKCEARNLSVSCADIQAMTFNSFAYEIVKKEYVDCGFTKPPLVVDDVRNSVIITQLLDESPVSGLDYMNYSMDMPNCKGALACTKKAFEFIKVNQIDPEEANAEKELAGALEECKILRFYGNGAIASLLTLYKDYDRRLKEENLVQFADQEPLMKYILELYPGYLEQYGFRHIIVDEFQDSNEIQLATIKRFTECSTFESLMVVGDDAQSIYGFRHTSVDNILNFFEKMEMHGTDLYLVENRRSTPEILELANKINKLNKKRVDKDMLPVRDSGTRPIVKGFHSKKDEYEYISKEIKLLIENGMQPEDIACIAYKKSELAAIGAELTRQDIPWVMMNPLRLMDNSNVQAAVSLAEAFYQPEAEELYFNYLNAKYRGEIFEKLQMDDIKTAIQKMKQEFMSIDLLDMNYQRHIFHEYLESLKENDEIYEGFLEMVYQNEDLQSELEYIHNFSVFGEKVEKRMLQKYRGVVLTTAHSSKGLEWKAVFNTISGYDSKSLRGGGPKRNEEIEETRRLLFVSFTRARDILNVTGQYLLHSSKEEPIYNQFLEEVFEALDEEYQPVDLSAALKLEQRKENAASRKRKMRGEMTPEEKKEYAKMVRNAHQISLTEVI